MLDFQESIREMVRDGRWDLPLPGLGETPRRLLMLSQIARRDLSLGRIAEGHTDATAILAEAGMAPRKGCLYGVWTADDPSAPVKAEKQSDSGWRLQGVKRWCCASTIANAALVTAQVDAGLFLFDVAIGEQVQPQPSEWQTPALAEARISAVRFEASNSTLSRPIGPPDWYLRRPGFWNGAVGAAAVWAGGAMSLIDAARDFQPTTRDSREHISALEAIGWQLGAVLDQCGREIDEETGELAGRARVRTLMVRHLVERSCTEVMERFGRATGDQFLAHDAFVANQFSALNLCIRQARIDWEIENFSIPD